MVKKTPKQEPKKKRKFLLWFWLLSIGGMSLVTLLFYLIANDFLGVLPSFEELENPKSNLATEIYSSDHKILGKYFKENRTNITQDELSPYLIEALVATEDERYYNHSGIDARGLARAIAFGGSKGGASTITQQLAKMLFHERALSKIGRVKQKLQEWVISARLERQYTKDEIITMYLNKFDFVNNAVGIKSAANVYFNREPQNLKIEQAAMLIGMAKNPSLFNPIRRDSITLLRRNVVLKQMEKNEYITETQYDSLTQLSLNLDYKKVDHKEGIAPYFREILRSKLKKIFREKKTDSDEYVLAKPDGSPYSIYKDGLKIYTTIDYKMQQYAEYAVSQHLGKELQIDFFRDLKRKGKKAPFDWRVSQAEVDGILNNAIKRTDKYRVLIGKQCANCGRRGKIISEITENGHDYFYCTAKDCLHKSRVIPKDSIKIIFNTPRKMRVFSWQGEMDTLMSSIDSIRYYKSFLQAGMMSMDPHTGFIKAWVGGIDYRHFKYDHVQQSKRQVGSTFKPFVYCLAIQEGYSPCYMVPNIRPVFEKEKWGLDADWSPKNSDNLYGCEVSLKYALANSMNTITAWVLKQFGPKAPQQVINLARKMGITSHIDPVPSICLGVADLSVYEMVGANATFANKGVWTEPIYITRIENKNGIVIKDFVPKTNEAMNEQTAYVMLNLMKGVVRSVRNDCLGAKRREAKIKRGEHPRPWAYNKSSTAMRIRMPQTKKRPYAGIKYPMAAKTGTTQNNSDGWFMGITPDLVTGVWVGAEDRSVRFSRTALGQGANMALPIYGYYMHKIYEDPLMDNISKKDFEKPNFRLSIELDCDQNKFNPNSFNNDDEPDFSQP